MTDIQDTKTRNLAEFDRLISELKVIRKESHDYSTERNHRGPSEYISSENRDKFIELRTACVALLNKLSSKDTKLKQSIDPIRDREVSIFNIEATITDMQSFRAEYAAGILESFPRRHTLYSQPQTWLTNNRTAIVVAIIGLCGVIAAPIIDGLLKQTAPTATPIPITATVVPSSTPTVTVTLTPITATVVPSSAPTVTVTLIP